MLRCWVVIHGSEYPNYIGRWDNLTLLLPCSHKVLSESFATPRTVACQASRSMGFPRQEYWRGLPFPPPGDLANPETEPTWPALAGGLGSPILTLLLCVFALVYTLVTRPQIMKHSVSITPEDSSCRFADSALVKPPDSPRVRTNTHTTAMLTSISSGQFCQFLRFAILYLIQ